MSYDLLIDNQAYCEVESNIPSAEIILKWNGNSLTDDKKTVSQYGIAEGDMLFLQRARRAAPPGMYECYQSVLSNAYGI